MNLIPLKNACRKRVPWKFGEFVTHSGFFAVTFCTSVVQFLRCTETIKSCLQRKGFTAVRESVREKEDQRIT